MIRTVLVCLEIPKMRVSEHLIGQLQILQIGFEPPSFAREERAPCGAKPVEVSGRSAWACHVLSLKICSICGVLTGGAAMCFLLIGTTRRREVRLVRSLTLPPPARL